MVRVAQFIKSILAGVMISIGGSVFLSCENRYIGAFFFSVGLVAVVMLELNLYTGKIGYVFDNDKAFFADTLLSIVGNFVGCLAVGLMQSPIGAVTSIVGGKLAKGGYEAFADGILCGILILVCVEIYKKKKTALGILLCIPTFILCGFEHSIADMFYVINARAFTLDSAVFILFVVLGNAVGGLFIPLLIKLNIKLTKEKDGNGKDERIYPLENI